MSDDISPLSFGVTTYLPTTSESTDWNGITSFGMDPVGVGKTPPAPNTNETPTLAKTNTAGLVSSSVLDQLNALQGKLYDLNGNQIVPTSAGYINVGNQSNSGMSTAGITNYLNNTTLETAVNMSGVTTTFTGTDLKLLIECTATGKKSEFKELIECHTLSVSSYRMKNPVRANGYTNPKGFSRGLRTIAGTMVLTELSVDVLLSFLQAIVVQDNSKNSHYVKTDQLPPFNITMVFANEDGFASYRTILGMEFLNDGTVYSVQDMLTERTISWMATDFTPLLPLNVSSLFVTQGTSAASRTEKTPADLMAKANNNATNITDSD